MNRITTCPVAPALDSSEHLLRNSYVVDPNILSAVLLKDSTVGGVGGRPGAGASGGLQARGRQYRTGVLALDLVTQKTRPEKCILNQRTTLNQVAPARYRVPCMHKVCICVQQQILHCCVLVLQLYRSALWRQQAHISASGHRASMSVTLSAFCTSSAPPPAAPPTSTNQYQCCTRHRLTGCPIRPPSR